MGQLPHRRRQVTDRPGDLQLGPVSRLTLGDLLLQSKMDANEDE